MTKKIAIITRKANFQGLAVKEALDLAMIMGSFEQDISLYFIGDGCFQLLNNSNAEIVASKDYTAVIDALAFYDVEQVYYCQHSALQRHIDVSNLKKDIAPLTQAELSKQLSSADQVLTF